MVMVIEILIIAVIIEDVVHNLLIMNHILKKFQLSKDIQKWFLRKEYNISQLRDHILTIFKVFE